MMSTPPLTKSIMPLEVNIGSVVTVKIKGKFQELQIVGSSEVDVAAGRISYLSPVGSALLGKAVGAQFGVELENGKLVPVEVVEIK